MSKAQIVAEIVLLLQGTPVADFARANFATNGDNPIVRCAMATTLATAEGEACKGGITTAYRPIRIASTGSSSRCSPICT